MSLPIDYHTHPQGHRTRSYSQELLQPWADAARERGLVEIVFTDHDRYKDGVRLEEISRLQENNPGITFLAGLELDNDPVTGTAGRSWVEKNWDQLDYVLGSVHYLPPEMEMFDQVSRGEEFAKRDLEKDCSSYLSEMEKMIALGHIDALAHLDLIKIHGVWRPPGGLLPYFRPLLERIKQAGLALEISSAGWRKPVGEAYPHEDLVSAAVALDIPLTLASDAHSPAQLGENFDRLEPLLKKWGVRRIARFHRHERTEVFLG